MTSVLASVNRALKARGEVPRLVRGTGYFYFAGGTTSGWPTASVSVWPVESLTVAEWLAEYDSLKADAATRQS